MKKLLSFIILISFASLYSQGSLYTEYSHFGLGFHYQNLPGSIKLSNGENYKLNEERYGLRLHLQLDEKVQRVESVFFDFSSSRWAPDIASNISITSFQSGVERMEKHTVFPDILYLQSGMASVGFFRSNPISDFDMTNNYQKLFALNTEGDELSVEEETYFNGYFVEVQVLTGLSFFQSRFISYDILADFNARLGQRKYQQVNYYSDLFWTHQMALQNRLNMNFNNVTLSFKYTLGFVKQEKNLLGSYHKKDKWTHTYTLEFLRELSPAREVF